MKNLLKPLPPYLALLALDFYLLPLLIRDTGTAMLAMLCGMPLLAFLAALACGLREGFQILLPPAAAALFLPSLPLFYNGSAWGYAVFYALVVLSGMALGCVFHGRR